MVRKGGFEPPRLSAPPPQDGVSASSTTSAQQLWQFIIAKGDGLPFEPVAVHLSNGVTLSAAVFQAERRTFAASVRDSLH